MKRAASSTAIAPSQSGGHVIPLRDEFSALEQRAGYTFRDPGLLEHALTHTSRANEDVSGGVFDNESLEFLGDAVLGFAIADLLFRRFPSRDEGWKSKMKAALVSTASLAQAGGRPRSRRAPAARARRREDRRTPQAGAARRWLRSVDCRDLSGRRHRTGNGIHREAVRGAGQRGARWRPRRSATSNRRCRSGCSRPAIRCPSTRSLAKPGPITTRCFKCKCAWVESRWPRPLDGVRRKQNRKPRGWRWRC